MVYYRLVVSSIGVANWSNNFEGVAFGADEAREDVAIPVHRSTKNAARMSSVPTRVDNMVIYRPDRKNTRPTKPILIRATKRFRRRCRRRVRGRLGRHDRGRARLSRRTLEIPKALAISFKP